MGFSTKKTTSTTTQTTSPAAPKRDTPPSKPDFILKVKGEDGKYQRIAGMWGPNDKGSFSVTFDADIEFKSTEDDRVKAIAFINDGEAKFGKRK